MSSLLNSIRERNGNHTREEMSYIFGRDPSILAYGQRPCPSQETKKNLLSSYEMEEFDSAEDTQSSLSDSSLKTLKVYLRLKPFPRKVILSPEQEEAYKIINSTTLVTKLPYLENNSSFARTKSSDIQCKTYTFTQTFGPEVTQLQFFDQVIKQQMVDFLGGQNCNVMTYGTTNSGKSHTLQGTIISPGIIPRALEFVFSIITPKSLPSYKPLHHSDATFLNSLERAQELEAKTKLLSFNSVDKNQYINTYKQMQKILQEESPLRASECSDAHYSVWVSFAEIYNETVYDLLTIDCQKKKVPLKLATDNFGRAFIKGLNTVYVNSGAEAYQVLMAGQYNLKVAATALNAKSSRSHCIFTIKLLKYYSENLIDTVNLSTFSFCDLAGSERVKKTLNIGERLKEAQNINTSLLVLGKCLKSIYDSQLSKLKSEPVIGPFRESKLTRLFKRALSGKEHIALIVNINPLPNLYVETQNVLNFAAIAKKIIIEPKVKEKIKPHTRFSKIVGRNIQSVINWEPTDLENTDGDTEAELDDMKLISSEEYENLILTNRQLKKEITNLKNLALTREFELRQELVDTYTNIIKKIENDWKTRMKDVEEQQESSLQWSIKQIEEYYKQKLNTRKRVRSSEDNVEKTKDIKELEYENSHLTSKLVSMKDTIYELKQKNQVLSIEKNKIEYELSLIKEELKYTKCLVDAAEKDLFHDEERKHYVEEIKSQLSLKESHVKKLKEFLNEAKEEYIAITSDGRKKEHQIKEQEELIIEYEDKMEDMQEQIERINYLLADRNAMIEKLDENKQTMADKIIELENKLKLVNEDYEVDISYKQEVLNKSEHNETDNFCVNVIIKEDLSEKDETQSEETVNTSDTNKNISTEKIIIESEEKSISTKCKESLTLKEDKSCQTVELVTQEVILQTSFLENDVKNISIQTIDDMNYEKMEQKYNELKTKLETEFEKKEEDNLKIVKELQKNITKMEIDLNAKQIEKTNLENLIEENMKQQQVLVEKLQESNKKEKDKDDEITAIQKELKQMILAKDIEERSVTSMEKELKETLRVLDDREKELSFYKQKVSSLELRTFELNQELKPAQITSDQQIELVHDNRKLTEINELLNRSMKRKTTEFEELEMRYLRGIDSYNWTYKILQEEITELKVDQNQKLSFCSAPPPNGDAIKQLQTCADYTMVKDYESQSDKGDECNTESETLSVERSLRSKSKHNKAPTSAKSEMVDLSGSGSSKPDIKPQPPSSEKMKKKRGTRKKKLSLTNDEPVQDILPLEEVKGYDSQSDKGDESNTESKTLSVERSLRSKSKHYKAPTSAKSEMVDLSVSGSSKPDIKPQPPSSEKMKKKRGIRKKKLFVANDESVQDILPLEEVKGYESQSDKGDEFNTESKSLSVERSLRSRRKHNKVPTSAKSEMVDLSGSGSSKPDIKPQPPSSEKMKKKRGTRKKKLSLTNDEPVQDILPLEEVKGYESQSDKGDESNTESKTLSVERSLRSRRKHKKIYSSMKCKNMNYACTENFKRGIIRTSVREGMEDELSEEDFYEQTREEVMHYVPCPSPAHRGRKICIWDGKEHHYYD